MEKIPRRALDEYTRGVNAASRSAIEMFLADVAGLDWTSPVADVRNALIEIMRVCCSSAADNAALVSAEFYDAARTISKGRPYGAVTESGYNPNATAGAVRAFVQDLVDGKGSRSVITKCRERIDYEAKRGAGNCIKANCARDPSHPRYARVPSGSETCKFCLMLASRGPVYRNADSAGEGGHWHGNCDCRVVPIWGGKYVRTDAGGLVMRGGTEIEGYDPDALYDRYLDDMLDPAFAQTVARKAEEAHASEGGRTGRPSAKTREFLLADARRAGKVTFADVAEMGQSIRAVTDYAKLMELVEQINAELPYFYPSEAAIKVLKDNLKSKRLQLIAEQS